MQRVVAVRARDNQPNRAQTSAATFAYLIYFGLLCMRHCARGKYALHSLSRNMSAMLIFIMRAHVYCAAMQKYDTYVICQHCSRVA